MKLINVEVEYIRKRWVKEIYIEIGKILAVYQQRSQIRSNAKKLMKQLDESYSNVRMFGMYDDCGSSYIQEYERIRHTIDEVVKQKISMDKYCKKLRLEFIEKYPEYEVELMEALK